MAAVNMRAADQPMPERLHDPPASGRTAAIGISGPFLLIYRRLGSRSELRLSSAPHRRDRNGREKMAPVPGKATLPPRPNWLAAISQTG